MQWMPGPRSQIEFPSYCCSMSSEPSVPLIAEIELGSLRLQNILYIVSMDVVMMLPYDLWPTLHDILPSYIVRLYLLLTGSD